jgi:UDP-GlcNAc:undecaprenyl-phosphate/decaprenyl-phosphate GlcNAc-1-phosphate transferase
MTNAILKFLIAFLVTAVTVKALSRPAIRIGLVDRPGGRKRHDAPVPLIGGPAMFAGFVFGALTLLESLYVYRVLFVSMALLVVVGVLDDARDLRPSSKSVAQLVAALFMTSWAGLFVMQLGNLFGFVVLDLRNWAIPFTVVCVLGVINAINMADGLDGLAGGLVLVALGFLCAGAVDVGDLGAAKLLALMAASVAGFLVFNIRLPWQPRARAFMGDSGSMMLGFFLVWFCVELTQISSPRLDPMSVVWFLAVPLLDMGFVILRRVTKGRSPFAADRTHLHHILLAAGFTPGQITWIMIALATVFAAVGWAGWRHGWPGYVMFYAFVAVFAVVALIGRRAWRLVRLGKRLRASRRVA